MSPARGLITPFRRDRKRDFANDTGDVLLASKVAQVLATECASNAIAGELPWRTSFGTPLQLLRHRPNDAALVELARVYVRDALKKWVPEATLVGLRVLADGDVLTLRVRFRGNDGVVEVSTSLPRAAPG